MPHPTALPQAPPPTARPAQRGPTDAWPGLDLLCAGRVHEITGEGRRAFATALAGQAQGPVLWLIERRRPDMLCPQGIRPFLDPARLILVRPAGAREMLQVTEEALRAGAAPVVVAELDAAPDLTASRRLQLAAGTGGGRGLCLIPERGLCANAAETRWRATPLAATDATIGAGAPQCWEILKNKRGNLGRWQVALGPLTAV